MVENSKQLAVSGVDGGIMITMPDDGLARVGRYVVNRRVALGYKYRIDLAKDLPITDRTLADIENGVREASLGTYAVVENKLGWMPGGIEAIRGGSEPVAVQANSPTTPSNPLRPVPTEALLLELRRRIVWGHVRFDRDDRGWGALAARGDGSEYG
ncbi:helix-turn-helix transcriptional regulator [Mycobacterium sp. SM1]|uniref:helix-turn-helix domain-containing protein n=1 Tax=Mycobacterium sp. SM1 TaxID=2816243 RepID=UPI001BCF8935|nr:helix-turn-helix transcriptional regulator [Mycobacterium sp. SM1]MBS4729787.1 helix-turn-helix transcriptional regulator [Mycobacterium sp. SM1]